MNKSTPTVAAAARTLLLADIAVVEDLSALLRTAPPTIRKWLREGRLPGRKIGRRWIIERRALLHALRPAAADLRLVGAEERP